MTHSDPDETAADDAHLTLREALEAEKTKSATYIGELAALTRMLAECEGKLKLAQAQTVELAVKISDMQNSRSWKLTAPLRWLSARARRG